MNCFSNVRVILGFQAFDYFLSADRLEAVCHLEWSSFEGICSQFCFDKFLVNSSVLYLPVM